MTASKPSRTVALDDGILTWVAIMLAGGIALLLAVLFSGCTGRNLHPELREDPTVLARQWVRSTHADPIGQAVPTSKTLEAGDRGSEYSNPVVWNNTLIFGSRARGLTSLYPLHNLERWHLPIHGGVVSELEVAGDQVYFGAGDGHLYCVTLETGKVVWKYDLRNPILSRPTFAQNRVFVTTTDDAVYALDAGTGKWLWHYRRRSVPAASVNRASAPLVDGQEVLAGLSDGYLVTLNLPDGALKWERKLGGTSKFVDVDARPVLDKGVIYVPAYDGALYALKRTNGDVIWKFDAGGARTVTLDGDRVLFPSNDGTLYALSKANAKILWKFDLDRGTPTQVTLADEWVLFGSSNQFLYAVSRETGRAVYRQNVGMESGFGGVGAYDAVNRRFYILSHGGNLYSYLVRSPLRKAFPHGRRDGYVF